MLTGHNIGSRHGHRGHTLLAVGDDVGVRIMVHCRHTKHDKKKSCPEPPRAMVKVVQYARMKSRKYKITPLANMFPKPFPFIRRHSRNRAAEKMNKRVRMSRHVVSARLGFLTVRSWSRDGVVQRRIDCGSDVPRG